MEMLSPIGEILSLIWQILSLIWEILSPIVETLSADVEMLSLIWDILSLFWLILSPNFGETLSPERGEFQLSVFTILGDSIFRVGDTAVSTFWEPPEGEFHLLL